MMKAERIALASLCGPPPLPSALRRCAEKIRRGEIFIYPTETVYGIGGIAGSETERKIIAAKKRPSSSPMILAAGSIDDFAGYEFVMHRSAKKLAEKFWPGNLTLVLESRALGRKIGVRVSSHP